MTPPVYRDVDPRELRLPAHMQAGADLWKLHRQIAKYGQTMDTLPPPLVFECPDGYFILWDGVTRATRIAKFLPGTLMTVEVIGRHPRSLAQAKTVGDTLP